MILNNRLLGCLMAIVASPAVADELVQDYLQAAAAACQAYRHDLIRYNGCRSEQMKHVGELTERIDKAAISNSRRDRARLSCRAELNKGVLEYDSCLRKQLHLTAGSAGAHTAGMSGTPACAGRDSDPTSLFQLLAHSVSVVRGAVFGRHHRLDTAVASDPGHLLAN